MENDTELRAMCEWLKGQPVPCAHGHSGCCLFGWWSASGLPCCACQHRKFGDIIRLISLKWLNWWGMEVLRARSETHKFHTVITLNSEEACGLCYFCPSLPTLGMRVLLLLNWLLFQHTHRLHWAAQSWKGAGADVGFRRGTACGSGPQWGVCFPAGLKVSVYLSAWQVLKHKARSGSATSVLSCLPLWSQKQLQL